MVERFYWWVSMESCVRWSSRRCLKCEERDTSRRTIRWPMLTLPPLPNGRGKFIISQDAIWPAALRTADGTRHVDNSLRHAFHDQDIQGSPCPGRTSQEVIDATVLPTVRKGDGHILAFSPFQQPFVLRTIRGKVMDHHFFILARFASISFRFCLIGLTIINTAVLHYAFGPDGRYR